MTEGQVRIYADTAGKWRWRAVTPNNEIVADSAQGYSRASSARRAARRFAPHWPVITTRR